MIVFHQIVLVLNLLVTLILGIAYFVSESPKVSPKAKAKTGVLLATSFLAFLVLLTLFAIASAILRQNALYLALLLFVIVPFVIGRLASYRTLGFYTILQILTLLLSAATLYVNLAVAAIYQMDVLLTWNCRHINNSIALPTTISEIALSGCRCPKTLPPVEFPEVCDVR